jgi:glycosyltransferase involved in cell wall biosynthesis
MSVVPISVVIPALNAERFIAEAIESVHAQTLKVSEIIVVDNGCTDRTAQIASELGAIVVDEQQRGLSRARNAGLRRRARVIFG